MRILASILHRSLRYRAALKRRVHRARGVMEAKLSGGSLEWPHSATANVPVRIDGMGHVAMCERVMLRYLPAPRVGTGEILLQARGPNSRISIGAGTAMSNNVSIIAMKDVVIGEKCQIGDMVEVFDCDFHEINPTTRGRSAGEMAPVWIGNNVWLGSRVMVLKGVSIGDNTVVGAMSLVNRSLPANVIAAGVPARVIREIAASDS